MVVRIYQAREAFGGFVISFVLGALFVLGYQNLSGSWFGVMMSFYSLVFLVLFLNFIHDHCGVGSSEPVDRRY